MEKIRDNGKTGCGSEEISSRDLRNKMLSVMFAAYILIFAIGSAIARDRSFSDMENRNLEQFPAFNAKTVLDGSFSERFEKYMSDQIIGKDLLVQLKVAENRLLNQSLINGVYFCEDDMLISDYVNPYKQLTKNLGYVNEFAENHPELACTWLLVPNACCIYEDKLPPYAGCYNQREVMAYIVGNTNENILAADCTQALKDLREEYIFYRTDHHWTMNGAYIGYTVLCGALGAEPVEKDRYEISVGSDKFLGTQYSKAPMFGQRADTLLLYHNPEGIYTVEYVEDRITTDSLYNYDALAVKDKYAVYLDGNHPLIKITSNASNQEKLLVVKDSYAHSLLPFLADSFGEIYVADLRYYHQSISELAREEGITRVVFINNLEFLSTDDSFLWLQ